MQNSGIFLMNQWGRLRRIFRLRARLRGLEGSDNGTPFYPLYPPCLDPSRQAEHCTHI